MQEQKQINLTHLGFSKGVQTIPNQLRWQSCRRNVQQFNSLLRLQQLIKNEYFLLTTESQQKKSFQDKLQKTLFSYYRSTINMAQTTFQTLQQQSSKLQRQRQYSNTNMTVKEKVERSVTQKIDKTQKNNKISQKNEKIQKFEEQKHLFSDQGFGDAYTFIKEILLSFSKNPYLMMILIEKYQYKSNIQSYTSLIKVIVNSMYENIVDDDVFNKDLIKIIIYCLKKLIEDKKHYFQINLNQEGFIPLILKQLIQRNDSKNYSKQIAKNTLLEIAKLDHFIDFKGEDQDKSSYNKSSKMQLRTKMSQESPVKPNNINPNNAKAYDKRSKLKQYTQGLRFHDQKIKRGSIIRKKYKNCITDQLLSKLGISEQVNFPCFSYKGNIQLKLQQQINKQLGIMLNKNEVLNMDGYNQDIIIMKNIILIFFNDLFKMLYSMPAFIRISSKILFQYLNLKFNNKNSLYVVADFIIGFWLTSGLRLDVTMIQATKLSPYLQQNIQQVISLIKSIVKDNYKDVPQSFIKHFNLLVSNLKISIVNYICQVINIDSKKIDILCKEVQDHLENIKENKECSKTQIRNIKSFCVCISMSDIKKFFQMIKGAQKQINQVNDKIIKRIDRIQIMSEDNDFFGDKKEKSSGKWYRANRAYALITQLSLPSHLSIDYQKTYNNSVKDNKAKNLLRQVLLNLNDISAYEQYYTSNTIVDFIQSIQFGLENSCFYTIDRIPLQLKLQYLQILSQKYNLFQVVLQLQQDTLQRFKTFKETSQRSKQCYLRAISSIKFQNDKLALKEQFIRNELKRRKLQQFFSKNEIKLCLTSPKTREKEIVLKTTLMKDVLQQYKQKLWLQNQNKCIHAALNLQFIKSLTGQTQKTKTKYQSHINNIMKFSQILCSLPEVKERFNTIDDSIGIKQVFFEFIQYIRDYIRSKQNQYAILLQNIQWLQQNIQLKISKRLYEKLYPKYPLYDDIALYLRLKTLDWISFEHLNIRQQLRKCNILQVAANHLRLIDKLRTAAQKLHCIQQTNKIIVNSYRLMCKNDNPATADDINPLMILVLIKSAPKRLISSINFIQSFASQSKLLSKEGYCFSQLKAAVHFCDTLTSFYIQTDQSEAIKYVQFNTKIYEKQIQYGIYFMVPKCKQSPKSQKKKLEYLKQYFKKKQLQDYK